MKCGDLVILWDLKTADFNGLIGEIAGEYQIIRKRWPVRVHWRRKTVIRLKPENILTEEEFMFRAVTLCDPTALALLKPAEILSILSIVVAGCETLSRDLTRRLFGDHRILEHLAAHYLECPKPDPRIWGILSFYATNLIGEIGAQCVVTKILDKAGELFWNQWMAFMRGPIGKVTSESCEEKLIDVWVNFGSTLGCTQMSDWAVFMWSLFLHNPLNLRLVHDNLKHFSMCVAKPPSLKECSHMLRCRRCTRVEAKGAHLRQCFRCGLVRYCSAQCQLDDWPDHQRRCKCCVCFHPKCTRSSTNRSCSTKIEVRKKK